MTDPVQNTVVGSEGLRQPRFKAALDMCTPDIMALDANKLLKQNIDVPTILTTVLGALPEIRGLQAACAKAYPLSDNTLFDKLEPRALALGYAYTLFRAAATPALPVLELSEKLLEKRIPLEADVRAAAGRGYIDAARLKDLPNSVGYKNQAFGTLLLTALARGSWARLQGKTAITQEELDEAEVLADQLLTAVGEREQLPVVEQAAADIKARAYTLVMQTYDAILRDLTHLRWHEGDVDEVAPSLRGKLSKRKGSDANDEEADAQAAARAQDAKAGSAVSTHGTTRHDSGIVEAVTAHDSDVPVGMPGASPFIKTGS